MTQPYQSRRQRHQKKRKTNSWLSFLPVGGLFLIGTIYAINSLINDLTPQPEEAGATVSSKLLSDKEQATRSLLKQLADQKWLKSQNYSTEEQTFLIDNQNNEDDLGLLFSHFPKENAPDIVTGKEVSEDFSDSLTRVYYDFSSYTWNEEKHAFDRADSNSGEAHFVKKDTKRLPVITDFFSDDTELMHSHFLIQQEILNNSKDGSAILDQVLAKAPFKTSELTVTKVNDMGIQVKLAQPVGDVSTVLFPWAEFAYYLNPKTVSINYFPKSSNKQVALTFDDGPLPGTTKKLLTILKEEQVPATFFVLGSQAQLYPEVLQEIISDGHVIGNHSFDHKNLTELTADAVKLEMQETDKVVYNATGQLPRYIRPPYGAMKESIAKTLDQPLIHWNIDTEDWKKGKAETIVDTINNQLEDHSVILLHDIHETSVDAVQPLIHSLKEQGYEFTTINTIFEGPRSRTQYFGGSREINVF
ncbi:hypothetical protein BAU15_11135 [Enterococcus sp. JM4C]|uniref:polysaccharide deacetylase family protein n=1 Tax=Candidatus Enterococcus huntleyi TaxID=1857217 RepID=UPI00137A2A52|nr:polysaccharide deacetylase family protein [Enterococcus sp. JM4C]KAF1298672.1 hypothetical protein BAU15_11135 [Enterococcus sp. JM4C]